MRKNLILIAQFAAVMVTSKVSGETLSMVRPGIFNDNIGSVIKYVPGRYPVKSIITLTSLTNKVTH